MSDDTGIEWTDATWNPIRGCSRVSEGFLGFWPLSDTAAADVAAQLGAVS